MSECRLVFGALELTDPLGPYVVHGEGADLGNPVPVVVAMERMLQDGAVASTLRNDNRTQKFFVTVKGADGIALAENERALVLETGKRNTLSWTPPNGFAPTTVFDVQTSWLDNTFDDMSELRGERVYGLTITALPFGRSVSEVVTSALTTGTGADTLVNSCDATTGWTATDGTLSVDTTQKIEGAGSLKIESFGSTWEQISGDTWRVTVTGTYTLSGLALDLSTTPYPRVSAWTAHSDTHKVEAWVDGVSVPLVSSRRRVANSGWMEYTFYSPDAAVAELRFKVTQTHVGTYPGGPNGSPVFPAEWKIRLDDVRRGAAIPASSSTGRQSLRTVEVKGSTRTVASLSVGHATNGLGDVMVYTSPSLGRGYSPDLDRWRVSSQTPTTDSARISGRSVPMSNVVREVFEFPADPMPRGGYLFAARLSAEVTDRRLTYTAATLVNGNLVGSRTYTSRIVPLTGMGVYAFFTLGSLVLPPTDVQAGSTSLIRLTVYDLAAVDTASEKVYRDEFYLLSMRDGATVSVVSCGGTGAATLGSANSRLWLDAPSVAHPTPAAWIGTEADRSNAYHAGNATDTWGIHNFAPPATDLFVANSGAANPLVEIRHFPHWHTNAAS